MSSHRTYSSTSYLAISVRFFLPGAVLSIAFLYEQKPGLDERFREVLAVLALSTGASATRQGVRYLVTKGLTGKTAEAVMKKVAGRFMARKLPAIAPVVGSIAGAGLNYMAVRATGRIAIEYYAEALEEAAIRRELKEKEESVKQEETNDLRQAPKKKSSGKKKAPTRKKPA
ncbi:MAG: hypothetical protein R3338_03525, partial [Thermoanaerobaculia bacterium]|nr:hypothetical protein [Thermoanaerobaculia bacterium]